MEAREIVPSQQFQVPALDQRFRPVTSKRASLVLCLCGEAGIGKSHAAARLLAGLPCRSSSLPATAGLQAWADTLPRSRRLAPWARRTLEGTAAGQPVTPADLAAALSTQLAEAAPYVLHVEDLHEASDAGLELVRQLARASRTVRGVAILVTSRGEAPEPFQSVHLEPLDQEASTRLLEAEAGAALPPAASAWVFARAAGNPLYTLEFFRYLSSHGHLWSDGHRWRWRPPATPSLPKTVEALVGQRLALAGSRADDGAVIKARALLGPDAAGPLWASVAQASEAELEASVGRLSQAGLLSGGDFAHPLFREVSLKELGADDRRDLARRALSALADRPLAAARFIDDAAWPPERALEVLTAAGEAATDAVQAARLRARAARYAKGEAREALALEAVMVLQHHDLAEALRLVESYAAEGAGDLDALHAHVHLLARFGRQEEADAMAMKAAEHLGDRTRATSLLVTSRHVAGDPAGAWSRWEAQPELHDDPVPELLRAVTASALATGRVAEAKRLIRRGLDTITDVAMRCEFLSLEAILAFHAGDARTADAIILQAIDLLDSLPAPRLRATALLNRAAFLRMLGDYPTMDACLEECLRLRQGSDDRRSVAFALCALADLRIEQLRFDEADDLLTEAIATLEPYGDSRYLIVARSLASALGLAQGTPLSRLTALQHAEQALAAARASQNPRIVREVLFDASLANTAVGRPARGHELALASQALAQSAGDSPNDAYRGLWALALAEEASGDPRAAEAHLAEALALAERTEGTIDTHKIGLELARLRGDADDAGARLAWFEARGLQNGAAIARRYFPGSTPSPAPKPVVVAAETSPRPSARLEVLGAMRLQTDEPQPVRGDKRRRLLALLLEARVSGRGGVARLALLDELYPDHDEGRAASSLKELVRGLRAAFGAGLVLTTPEGYALGDCGSDVEQYLAAPEASLWRGPYLDGIDPDGPVRDSLYLALADHVESLARTDPREAARLGRILVEAEPYRLDHLATHLRALRAADNHRSLDRHYQAARARFSAELGEALPPRWQDFLDPAQA